MNGDDSDAHVIQTDAARAAKASGATHGDGPVRLLLLLIPFDRLTLLSIKRSIGYFLFCLCCSAM